jgi:nucleotide-binding universal stress UspA family protein
VELRQQPAARGQGDSSPSEAAWQAAAEAAWRPCSTSCRGPAVELRPVVAARQHHPGAARGQPAAAHLVVGSRGPRRLRGMLLGSTSDSLVRHAACPVTVVRTPSTEGSAD